MGLAELEMLHNIPRAYVLIAVLGGMILLGGIFVWRTFFDDYHFAVVQPGVLYRDGYKDSRNFWTAITKSQAKTVVVLLEDKEWSKDEYDAIAHSRLKAVALPVKLGGYPTTKDVQEFLSTVENDRRKPVLVHCAQGIRRTGMMVAAYQLSVMGWDKQRAKDAILAFGHSERTIGDIKRFIDVYDPQKREVTQDLGMGTE